MDGIFKVPIRNLFCLLSYANEMPELANSLQDIDEDLITYDFMVKKFLQEAEGLLQHRFVKNYVTSEELTKNLGGRMLVNESMPYLMTKMPMLVCEKDHYSSDILLNQIMKSTLRAIRDNRLIKEEIRKKSYLLMEAIPEIEAKKLTKEIFYKIHFSRHTAHYKRMVHIARLLHELVLLSHKHGNWSLFSAEIDEKALNQLFEKFLFHFYRIEQKNYNVSSEIMQWQLSGNNSFLPSMKTDVSLTNKNGLEKIVIDAKFYKNMFQENYGKSTFHSHNMYQLFTYLMHQPSNLNIRGVLIYPYNGFEVNEIYQWDDRINMEVMTINLNESWGNIYRNLLNLIER
jgi:5-methylcytosine-specific restriction enzyme subunit McrC